MKQSITRVNAGRGYFHIIGAGLTVKMTRDPDTDAQIAGISSIEEVSRTGSEWRVTARLNGDQTNQGRQLTMDSHQVKIYRLRMYAARLGRFLDSPAAGQYKSTVKRLLGPATL